MAAGVNNGLFVALARLNSNGALDTTFNNTGKLITTIAANGDACNNGEILIQPDGKIVAGGLGSINSVTTFVMQRFNIDGSRDNTFSAVATTGTNFSSSYIYSLVQQSDGKIVGAGGNQDHFVFRTLTNGALDGSFGTNGKITIDVAGLNQSDSATAVAIQPDGKIVLGGFAYANSNAIVNCAVTRIYPGGTNLKPQKSFNDFDGDGKTDFVVYRDGNWDILQSSNNQSAARQFGLGSDKPVPARPTFCHTKTISENACQVELNAKSF